MSTVPTPDHTIDPKIVKAANDYNQSPWVNYGQPIQPEEFKNVPVEEALESIRRADIANFHREEGACGNI